MSSNIKVIVRPRPLDECKKEKWALGFELNAGRRRITIGQRVYDPDVTLEEKATQDDLFEHCQSPIDAVRSGNNGTIMVYGQTGTGKTYSMFGAGPEDTSGVTFRTIQALLEHVEEGTRNGRRMSLSCSVLELYNEKFADLLNDGEEVTLINGFPRQIKKEVLPCVRTAHNLVKKAAAKRHVTPTAMNERSSRSHLIVMLELNEFITEERFTTAHLFLVDLAGSESTKKSQATGKAAVEAGMINKSLLALKQVVLTLASHNQEGPRPYVPYRDSKLTEILQDSIGGTARTCLVACVSPLGRDIEETKNTLEYSSKARSIKNVQDRDKLQFRLRTLEVENEKLKNKLAAQTNERGSITIGKDEYEEMYAIKDHRDQLLEDLKVFETMHKQQNAAQSVNQSQTEMMREMLKKTERDLELSQGAHFEAVSKHEESLKRMHQATTAANREVLDQAQTFIEFVLAKEKSTKLDFSNFQADIKEAVDKFNKRISEEMDQLAVIGEELESDVIQGHQNMCLEMESLEEEWMEMQQQIVKKMKSVRAKHGKELQERAQNSAQRIQTVKGQYSSSSSSTGRGGPLDSMPFEHATENLEAQFEDEKKADTTTQQKADHLLHAGTNVSRKLSANLTAIQGGSDLIVSMKAFDGVSLPPPAQPSSTTLAVAGTSFKDRSPSRGTGVERGSFVAQGVLSGAGPVPSSSQQQQNQQQTRAMLLRQQATTAATANRSETPQPAPQPEGDDLENDEIASQGARSVGASNNNNNNNNNNNKRFAPNGNSKHQSFHQRQTVGGVSERKALAAASHNDGNQVVSAPGKKRTRSTAALGRQTGAETDEVLQNNRRRF